MLNFNQVYHMLDFNQVRPTRPRHCVETQCLWTFPINLIEIKHVGESTDLRRKPLAPWRLGRLGALAPWAPWRLGRLGALGALAPWRLGALGALRPCAPWRLGALGALAPWAP